MFGLLALITLLLPFVGGSIDLAASIRDFDCLRVERVATSRRPYIGLSCFCILDDGDCTYTSGECDLGTTRVERLSFKDTVFWIFPKTVSHSFKYTVSKVDIHPKQLSVLHFIDAYDSITTGYPELLRLVENPMLSVPNFFESRSRMPIVLKVLNFGIGKTPLQSICRNYGAMTKVCCTDSGALVYDNIVGPPDTYGIAFKNFLGYYPGITERHFSVPYSVLKPVSPSETYLGFFFLSSLTFSNPEARFVLVPNLNLENPATCHYVVKHNSIEETTDSRNNSLADYRELLLNSKVWNCANGPYPNLRICTNLHDESIREFVFDDEQVKLALESLSDPYGSFAEIPSEYRKNIATFLDGTGFSLRDLAKSIPTADPVMYSAYGFSFTRVKELLFVADPERPNFGFVYSTLCLDLTTDLSTVKFSYKFRLAAGQLFLDNFDYLFLLRLCDRLLLYSYPLRDIKPLVVDYAHCVNDSTLGVAVPISLLDDGQLQYRRIIFTGGHYCLGKLLVYRLSFMSTHVATFDDAWYSKMFLFLRNILGSVLSWLLSVTFSLFDNVFGLVYDLGGCCIMTFLYAILDVTIFVVLLHTEWCLTYFILSYIITILLRLFTESCCFDLGSRISSLVVMYDLDI